MSQLLIKGGQTDRNLKTGIDVFSNLAMNKHALKSLIHSVFNSNGNLYIKTADSLSV